MTNLARSQLKDATLQAINTLAAQARRHDEDISIYLSHTWPATAEEEHLLRKIILLVDDLHLAGITVVTPLVSWRDDQQPLEEFIQQSLPACHGMLAVASPSYKAAAIVTGSPTQLEIAQAQAAGCTILPVVVAGGFGDSVPGELAAVLGTSCATTAAYCEFAPGLIANLLGLGTTATDVLKEHADKLRVLKAALSKQDPSTMDMASLAAAHQEQVRSHLSCLSLLSLLSWVQLIAFAVG